MSAGSKASLSRFAGKKPLDYWFVMAGLVPAIHVLIAVAGVKTWMPGTSPGMTERAFR
jgi:hypothetical protein